MSTGIMIFAMGERYIRQGQALIKSLEYHNSNIQVHMLSETYADTRYLTDIRSKVFELSPFDNTIVVDSDIVFCSNIDSIIEKLNQQDFFMPTSVRTYRNEVVTSNYYRKAFEKNNLPNVYVAFSYFRKNEKTKKYFETLKLVNENWQHFYKIFCPNYMPKQPSMDVNHAICLLLHPEIENNQVDVNLVHLKSKIQNWKTSPNDWREKVSAYLPNPGELWIGNYKQTGIVHYTEGLLDE